MCLFFFYIIRRLPRATRTDTLVPYPTRVRSLAEGAIALRDAQLRRRDEPDQLPRHQPASARKDDRDARRESVEGARQHARRSRQGPVDAHRFGSVRGRRQHRDDTRSEEHTSELQSLLRTSYAVVCLKKKNINKITTKHLT